MLRLDNPDLPSADSELLTPTESPLFRLYDPVDAELGGVIAVVDKGANLDAEEIDLPSPIAKGYYHSTPLDPSFLEVSKEKFYFVDSALSAKPDTIWRSGSTLRFYSREDVSGSQSFQFSLSRFCREIDDNFVAKTDIPSITPSTVVVNGYSYPEGAGEGEWLYQDPTLEIATSSSSRIFIGDTINVTGEVITEVSSPIAQVLSFYLDPDIIIVGIDYLGVSFTEAVNSLEPLAEEYTLSTDGLLNLYVPLHISFPEVVTQGAKNLVVNTGYLTYPRPV